MSMLILLNELARVVSRELNTRLKRLSQENAERENTARAHKVSFVVRQLARETVGRKRFGYLQK